MTSVVNVRILLAQINPTIGDLRGNTNKILKGIDHAKQQQADLVLFPELSVTGYPPDDFLLLPHFIAAIADFLKEIQQASKGLTVIVGTPRQNLGKTEKFLFNSAAIFSNGKLLGYQDKLLLPTYDVFNERRYFEPANDLHLWEINGKRIAITICEDIWQYSTLVSAANYLRDPIAELQKESPDLLLNLSASPYSVNKTKIREAVCSKAAQALQCPVLLCNQVGGNDGLIFDGHSLYVDSKGKLLQRAKGFTEEFLFIDLNATPTAPSSAEEPIAELYQALVLGLRDYFHKSGFKKACLGLSGGIDSALVACIAVDALGANNVLALNMPSRYSSPGSVTDSEQLADRLGITLKSISIEPLFQTYLDLLQPHFEGLESDTTEENIQARIRGTLLMAFSNKQGYIVLSTGNKSELAMGYATLYGDMCGGLAVLSDVSKRYVYELSQWLNRDQERIPKNIIVKPPSAELRLNQKDIDSLPEYDIIDNVLQAYVEEHKSPQEISLQYGYPLDFVLDLVRRIHGNEYKRRQSAPGLRITEKAFSVGRHFPIVQGWCRGC